MHTFSKLQKEKTHLKDVSFQTGLKRSVTWKKESEIHFKQCFKELF